MKKKKDKKKKKQEKKEKKNERRKHGKTKCCQMTGGTHSLEGQQPAGPRVHCPRLKKSESMEYDPPEEILNRYPG